MSALPIIEAALSAAPTVTALVGDRIFYSVAPQSTPAPYVVLIGAGESEENMLQRSSGWPEGSVQAIVVAATFPEVENIGNAILATLKDARGEWRGTAANIWRDEIDSFDFIPATLQHRRVIGFTVRYRDA